MTRALFLYFVRANWKIFTIFTAVMLMYLFIVIGMYGVISDLGETDFGAGLDMPLVPSAMVLASMLYPSIVVILVMVYYIMVSNKLFAKSVDNTSMSCFLASGISRKRYGITAVAFMHFSLVVMIGILWAFGGIGLTAWGAYDFGTWTAVNLITLLCSMAVASLCMFLSMYFAHARSLVLGLVIGLPILFMLLFMLSDIPNIEFFRYATPFGYMDIPGLAFGDYDLWWLASLIFATLAAALSTATVYLFRRIQLNI